MRLTITTPQDPAGITRLFEVGQWPAARRLGMSLREAYPGGALRARIENDLGALEAVSGDLTAAGARFLEALSFDAKYTPAQENLAMLDEYLRDGRPAQPAVPPAVPVVGTDRPVRIAFLSLLFNWPSTGGGTIHTAEAGKFLARAGYDVRHIYASYPAWGLGLVTEPTHVPSVPLTFDETSWDAPTIQRRFREAVDAFSPDYVIITDSWSFKPFLAEAIRGYKYFLRLAALECLCPLNNVRLLVEESTGKISACPHQQLADPGRCQRCVRKNEHQSGSLHQAERALSGFGTPQYAATLRRAFAEAAGILAVNPQIAAMVRPHTQAVHVVPSGFDRERFPWPADDEQPQPHNEQLTLFFAGLVHEYMKGFHVLHEACERLWQKRQDFRLVATGDPPGPVDEFTTFLGWQSQDQLPQKIREADMLLFPTIAEEALGRSAVEAMGAGRPVIASRIGGLSHTVTDGVTGLLFEPGNVPDLMAQIERLLDDPALRQQLGRAGRRRFEECYTWDAIIEGHYRPLFTRPKTNAANPPPSAAHQASGPVTVPVLLVDTSRFFGLPLDEARQMFATYEAFHEAGPQIMSLEQGFVACVLLSLTRPAAIIAVGPDAAGAAQSLAALRSFVGLDAPVSWWRGGAPTEAPLGADVEILDAPFAGGIPQERLERHSSGLLWLSGGEEVGRAVGTALAEQQPAGLWSLAVVGGTAAGGPLGLPRGNEALAATHRDQTFSFSAAGRGADRLTLWVPHSAVLASEPAEVSRNTLALVPE